MKNFQEMSFEKKKRERGPRGEKEGEDAPKGRTGGGETAISPIAGRDQKTSGGKRWKGKKRGGNRSPWRRGIRGRSKIRTKGESSRKHATASALSSESHLN